MRIKVNRRVEERGAEFLDAIGRNLLGYIERVELGMEEGHGQRTLCRNIAAIRALFNLSDA
jgi:hypothetical protein